MGIVLKAGQDSDENNFGELLPASISGQRARQHAPATVPTRPTRRWRVSPCSCSTPVGTVIATQVTDADGMYHFNQPAAWHVLGARSPAQPATSTATPTWARPAASTAPTW